MKTETVETTLLSPIRLIVFLLLFLLSLSQEPFQTIMPSYNEKDPCRVLYGTHHGKKAWFKDQRKGSKQKYHLVIEDFDGEKVNKSVYKYMVRPGHHGTADNTMDAVLDQFPEVEEKLSAIASILTKCNIKDTTEIALALQQRVEIHRNHQKAKGSKAQWFKLRGYHLNGTKRERDSGSIGSMSCV